MDGDSRAVPGADDTSSPSGWAGPVPGRLARRLAGAPISWGVCEIPGWGVVLPPEEVLADMATLGLRATELGPIGYLGHDPAAIRRLLASYQLAATGGFFPLVLHDPAARRALEQAAERAAALLKAVGGRYMVTAAVADRAWSAPRTLDGAGWRVLLGGLGLVDAVCRAFDLVQVLHPHAGTQVATSDDVRRVLEGSDVRLCLDTGHLTIGGVDPAAFAAGHADRVGLVHLKDVRAALARRVGLDLTLREATRLGLFCALGRGDADVGGTVRALERAGYDGWYVLEQDRVIEGSLRSGARPLDEVAASIAALQRLFADAVEGRVVA